MGRPEDGYQYGWDSFVKWAELKGINLTQEDDWSAWWDCWRAAQGHGSLIENDGKS